MYIEYYGLKDFPFQLTPDPRFFFESSVHRKAMAHLLFGLEQSEGFIVVTGEVGAGKTTIIGHLLATLDSNAFVVGKIVSTQLQADDLLRAVASAFNIDFEGADKTTLLRRIEDFLISRYHAGQRCLLLVDEAQNLTPQALEELRMLSNFQVGERVPLQSFLLGQPQFRRMLARADLEQFRQRVIASYHLGPMSADETRDYIRHRLTMVGWSGDPAISEEAYSAIFLHTGGVPRKINTLCSRLLMSAFLDELHQIDRDTVAEVAEDQRFEAQHIVDSSAGAEVLPLAAVGGQGGVAYISPEVERRLSELERRVTHHDQVFKRMLHLADSFAVGAEKD